MKKRNIEEEIQNLDVLVRDNEQIPPKVRNNILKQLEVIRKCAKPRRSNKGRNQNQNSGLLKPVIISEEMAKFAGWEKDELHSRVDVTKVICAYIKGDEKAGRPNLQKPSNKKTILPDQVLKDLLRWDADSEEMAISVADGSADGARAFSIIKIPSSGLKKPNYYNNSELRKADGEEVAVIKKVELLDNGNYGCILDREDVAFNAGDKYIVHVPLTYPKVQTKISIHLTKPKSDEEPAKKESKHKKEKKETTPKKEKSEAKAEKKPKKSKKVKEPEPSSDEE
jgi:chromatin remodeling complex protein RSC6